MDFFARPFGLSHSFQRLADEANKDKEKYNKFWQEFGYFIKEGGCTDKPNQVCCMSQVGMVEVLLNMTAHADVLTSQVARTTAAIAFVRK